MSDLLKRMQIFVNSGHFQKITIEGHSCGIRLTLSDFSGSISFATENTIEAAFDVAMKGYAIGLKAYKTRRLKTLQDMRANSLQDAEGYKKQIAELEKELND